MKKEITIQDLKDATELNKLTYQAFKKIVEFECKVNGTPAPSKINNVRLLQDEKGKKSFIVGNCDFADNIIKVYQYPLSWIFDVACCQTGRWKQYLADKAASKIYARVNNIIGVVNPFNKTYEIYNGPKILKTFQADCDLDAIDYFSNYFELYGISILEPGDVCGLHREDSNDCLSTWGYSDEKEEDKIEK